jgi:hypothetical protein
MHTMACAHGHAYTGKQQKLDYHKHVQFHTSSICLLLYIGAHTHTYTHTHIYTHTYIHSNGDAAFQTRTITQDDGNGNLYINEPFMDGENLLIPTTVVRVHD